MEGHPPRPGGLNGEYGKLYDALHEDIRGLEKKLDEHLAWATATVTEQTKQLTAMKATVGWHDWAIKLVLGGILGTAGVAVVDLVFTLLR